MTPNELAELERVRLWRRDMVDYLTVDMRELIESLYPRYNGLLCMLRIVSGREGVLLYQMGMRILWADLEAADAEAQRVANQSKEEDRCELSPKQSDV